MTLWFEQIELQKPYDLGSHTFTEEEIRRFGADFDPQYFHTDPDAAPHSQFGGLIASGWHTACVGHRIMVDRLSLEAESIRANGGEPGVAGPSPGVNEMVFKTPVRPGDTVTYTLRVTEKRPSKSLPGWGVLHNRVEASNQVGAFVYGAEVISFTRLRDYKPSPGERIKLFIAALPVIGPLLRRR